MASSALASATFRSSGIALTAVVCTYNRYDVLPGSIDSLLEQEVAEGTVEIVVVDNSPDQSRAVDFARGYRHVTNLVYVLEPTPGLANARNRGIREARAPIVAFIDDDARAARNWAQQLLVAYSAYAGRAGIVGGPVVPRWPGGKPAWLEGPLLSYLSLVDLGRERRELTAAEWLAGCNISFDKQSLLAAGGFATNLGRIGNGSALLSNEELEISDRIRALGKLAIYAPEAVVEHVIAPERLTPEWFCRRAAWQAVSDLLRDAAGGRDLAAAAQRRLVARGRKAHRRRWRHRRDDSAAVKHDVEAAYDRVIAALCGGDDRYAPRMRLNEKLRHAAAAVARARRSLVR